MKLNSRLLVIVALATLPLFLSANLFGIGGRGGGGGGFRGGGGGGGGRVGGGGGGFSGGGARPAARPSVGSAPSFSRPSGGGARPNPGGGARPNIQPGGNRPQIQPGGGNRPQIGNGPNAGNRPSTLPGNRPGAGQGIANRPGAGQGAGNRPATLPGLGQGNPGSRLPNQGANVQDRMANRPQTREDRRTQLNDRLAEGNREDRQGNRDQNRQDRQDNRDGNREDRQDWRDNNREDWQNWADDNMHNHGGWYHGCWNGNWYPGAGWGYMWDNYPGWTAFGLTMWGVNRLSYGFGYEDYSNPYYGGSSGGYDYSEPLMTYSDPAAATAEAPPSDPAAPPPGTTTEGLAAFDEARAAFYAGNYDQALKSLDVTLKTMPNDSVVHEFRGLTLFALKRYPEAAAAVYAVLSVGPGWDWTTLSSAYPSVDDYTAQLRALEAFVKATPDSSDGHFLLAYHYMTGNHAEAAVRQLKLAREKLPNDKLIRQLIATLAPDEAEKEAAAAPKPEQQTAGPEVKPEQLEGQWNAARGASHFELILNKDGTFVWTLVDQGKKQSVTGVFAVDQSTLALQPDSGGTMLAKITVTDPTHMNFLMVGGEPNDPGLNFLRSR